MKCPGCRAEMAEGSRYCSQCGGRITGGAVDYSVRARGPSEIYEPGNEGSHFSDTIDVADRTLIEIGSVRFMMALFMLPFLAAISLAAGFVQKRTELVVFGVFFAAMSMLMVVLWFKYYRGKDDVEAEEPERPSPLLLRRM